MINPIIIEITWLEWSWKTSLLNLLKNKNYFNNLWFIDDYEINLYEKKSIFCKIFDRIKNIILSFKIHFELFFLLLKNNDLILFLPISYYLVYKYYRAIKNKQGFFLYDEFLLHLVYWEIIKKYKNDKVDLKKLDNLIELLTKYINIFPIYINTNYEEHIKRTKKRNKLKYDKLSDVEKREILSKNGYLSQYITKTYCKLKSIPYLEIDWNLSLEEKEKILKQKISFIIDYIKKDS